jgi:hypothetical protein
MSVVTGMAQTFAVFPLPDPKDLNLPSGLAVHGLLHLAQDLVHRHRRLPLRLGHTLGGRTPGQGTT